MIHLLNGSTEPRVRSSEGVTVQPCGCAATDIMWLQMCDPHFQADNALRQQAHQDKLAEQFT
jgi:hypothetical protein